MHEDDVCLLIDDNEIMMIMMITVMRKQTATNQPTNQLLVTSLGLKKEK